MPGRRKWQLCLISEDDEVIRTELITLFRSNGYQPVKIQPYNLFLMDVNLPGGKRRFLMPQAAADRGLLPVALCFSALMNIPIGVIFEKVYEIWNLTGLRGGKTMEAAVLIALVIEGIYALYFVITYRIACSHVLCCGGEKQETEI